MKQSDNTQAPAYICQDADNRQQADDLPPYQLDSPRMAHGSNHQSESARMNIGIEGNSFNELRVISDEVPPSGDTDVTCETIEDSAS